MTSTTLDRKDRDMQARIEDPASSISGELEQAGESSERILTVAAWRDTPYFSDAERAALALTEAATRLADRSEPVPDDVWHEATRHYTEPELAGIVVAIAAINAFNRVNVTTRQISGEWVGRALHTTAHGG